MRVTVNDREVLVRLKAAIQGHRPELLKICGQYMLGSVMRTFNEQGSPAGSWAPLAAWTRMGAASRIGFRKVYAKGGENNQRTFTGEIRMTRKRGTGAMKSGKKILIDSARLRNSIMFEVKDVRVEIGTNLVYGRIHQLGGFAGRKSPSRGMNRHKESRRRKEGPFRRPYIPARPYLVFRPEDPQNMQIACDRFLQQKIDEQGIGGKRA